jgi:6-phosphogluconate dehydrogenase
MIRLISTKGKVEFIYKYINLLLDPGFKHQVLASQGGWHRKVSAAQTNGIPAPTFTPGFRHFDGFRYERLSANLLQAQRDCFGAHTCERTDQPRGKFFHTIWTGCGGSTAVSTYTV